jgi:hypothetical protein
MTRLRRSLLLYALITSSLHLSASSADGGMADLARVPLPSGGWAAFRLSSAGMAEFEAAIDVASESSDVVAGVWHEDGGALVGAMLTERLDGQLGPEAYLQTSVTGSMGGVGGGGSAADGPFSLSGPVVGMNEIVVVAVSAPATVVLRGQPGVELVATTSGSGAAAYRQRDFTGEANVAAGAPPLAMTKVLLDAHARSEASHRMYAQLWDYVVTGDSEARIQGPEEVQIEDASWATAGSWLLAYNSPSGHYDFTIDKSIDVIGSQSSPVIALAADVTLP